MLHIVRGERPKSGTTWLPRELIQDPRMDSKALALLVRLLSFPEDGWRTDHRTLARQFPEEGETVYRNAMKKLKAIGYVKQIKRRAERGQWVTDTIVYMTPQDPTVDVAPPSVDYPHSVDRDSVKPHSANPHSYKALTTKDLDQADPPDTAASEPMTHDQATSVPRPRSAASQPQQEQEQREKKHPFAKYIRDAIPAKLSRKINFKTMNDICHDLEADGWTWKGLHLAIRGEEWDEDTGAGLIVDWLRSVELPDAEPNCADCKGYGFIAKEAHDSTYERIEQCKCVDTVYQFNVPEVCTKEAPPEPRTDVAVYQPQQAANAQFDSLLGSLFGTQEDPWATQPTNAPF